MAVSDEDLEKFAKAGLEAAESSFWEYGQSPNGVLLINDAGEMALAEYANPGERSKVRAMAMIHKATAAVLVGEAYFRVVTPEEEAEREPGGYLRDDPKAREQLFGMAMRVGIKRSFVAAKEIIREDGGNIRLVDLAAVWREGVTDSWLMDALEQVFTPTGDGVRHSYAEWNKTRAETLIRRAWGE